MLLVAPFVFFSLASDSCRVAFDFALAADVSLSALDFTSRPPRPTVIKPTLSLLSLSSPFATLLRPREFRLLLSFGGWSHLLRPVGVVFIVCFGSLIGASFASVTGDGAIAAVIGAIAIFLGCVGRFSSISMNGSGPEPILINNGP